MLLFCALVTRGGGICYQQEPQGDGGEAKSQGGCMINIAHAELLTNFKGYPPDGLVLTLYRVRLKINREDERFPKLCLCFYKDHFQAFFSMVDNGV